jgi:hypothetical protein
VQGKPELSDVVRTLHPTSRLSGGINCWQQQRDEHRNDRDDHQKLHQRETSTPNRRLSAASQLEYHDHVALAA